VNVVVAVVLAAAFGGGDQYLGSLSAHPWGADISLLSAPWLLLAFLAGWTQPTARRGALLGLACTLAAWLAYGLMTLSPVENAHLSVASAAAFVASESRWIAASFLSGPLCGWLGWHWREHRAWTGALVVALAVALEPAVRAQTRVYAIRFRWIEIAEVACGCALALAVLAASARSRA
jgi:hypothetical protein